MKAMKILEIFEEIHKNHDHSKNQYENRENHVTLRSPFDNLRKS